jgi:predicted nucleotidyltransferase
MTASNAKSTEPIPAPCVVELREMLQSVLGDDFLRLYHYGSRVEGRAQADSDYDLLCVTRQPLSRGQKDEILDRQMDIELAHDVLLDLHFRDPEQTNSLSLTYSPYVDHVLSEGIVV